MTIPRNPPSQGGPPRRDRPDRDLDLLTSIEVAQLLRVPVSTVYYWRETKRGPRGAQVGKQVLYDRADVVAWWDARLRLDRSAS